MLSAAPGTQPKTDRKERANSVHFTDTNTSSGLFCQTVTVRPLGSQLEWYATPAPATEFRLDSISLSIVWSCLYRAVDTSGLGDRVWSAAAVNKTVVTAEFSYLTLWLKNESLHLIPQTQVSASLTDKHTCGFPSYLSQTVYSPVVFLDRLVLDSLIKFPNYQTAH